MTMVALRPEDGRFGAMATAAGQNSAAASFVRASRHSARVRFLRKAIPLGVLVAVTGLIAVWLIDPFRPVFPSNFSLQGFNLSSTQVTMQKPHLAGFKKDNRPYEVIAKSAIQDVTKPTIVNLQDMDAHFIMESGTSANLTAKIGVYDTQNETMDVKTDVRVKTTSGYDIRLESAKMEFKTGNVRSDKPVNVIMQGGEISADALEMLDNGKKVTFIGNVHSRLEAAASDTANKEPPVKQEAR
jgi:lipopolysaccharide export system protein LptC